MGLVWVCGHENVGGREESPGAEVGPINVSTFLTLSDTHVETFSASIPGKEVMVIPNEDDPLVELRFDVKIAT